MSSMRIPIKFRDRLRSQRGSPQACLIATAAQRQWGGSWSVTHKSAERTTDSGQVMQWRPSWGAHLVMWLFDAGLPVPVRSVKLVRGKALPGSPKARTSKASAPVHGRRARKVAAGAAAAGVLLLVVPGLAWVVLAIIGTAAAVSAAVLAVKLRTRQRDRRTKRLSVQTEPVRPPHDIPAVPPHLQQQPGIRAVIRPHRRRLADGGEMHPDFTPSFTLPQPPEPELEPVPGPAPKAAPVRTELPALERTGDRSSQ